MVIGIGIGIGIGHHVLLKGEPHGILRMISTTHDTQPIPSVTNLSVMSFFNSWTDPVVPTVRVLVCFVALGFWRGYV